MAHVRMLLEIGSMLGLCMVLACKADAPSSAPSVEEHAHQGESAQRGPGDASNPEVKTSIDLPPGDGPVAHVNGVSIPRDLFNQEYRQTMQRYQRARHEVKPALRERLKDNIVRRLVDAEVIRQQATKLEVTISPDEIDNKWTTHKKRYGSEEAFAAFLDRAGTTAKDVKRTFEANLLRERVFSEVSRNVTVEANEVRDFYKANERRYREPEQVKASHILFRVAPGTPAADRKKKEEAAKAVLARLKKGESFERLAEQFGEDPTKSRGGDLGFFARGRMVKPFEEAVWKLDKGTVSGLVETQFGIHLIKKTDHRAPRKRPLSEVRDQIERSLLARKRNQAIRESLDKWKKAARIDIIVTGDPSIIQAGQAQPAPPTVRKAKRLPPSTPAKPPGVAPQPGVSDPRGPNTR